MRFRVGLHVGDVMHKSDGSAYGDDINIAARLQATAQPGGIVVSESIRLAVRNKILVNFEDMGERSVKNVSGSFRTYRISADRANAAPASPSPEGNGSVFRQNEAKELADLLH